MPSDAWYFAYGSNLSPDQKEQRTGSIREAVRCWLPDYRLAFNKRGRGGQCYANIVPEPGQEVWGVIYLCDEGAFQRMDRCEGVAGGHYVRETIRVVLESGEERDAITYIAGNRFLCPEGAPSREYLGKIVDGALHHGLPQEYISQLQSKATG